MVPFSEAEQFFDVNSDGYLARVWRDFGLEPGGLVDTDVLVRFSVFARDPQVFDRDRRRWERDPRRLADLQLDSYRVHARRVTY